MGMSRLVQIVLPAAILAVVLVVGFSPTVAANQGAVTFTSGIVDVDNDGFVVVRTRDQGVLVPSNGFGLFVSGQIEPGDEVNVKIAQDKGHKHRGHVTILK